MKKLNNKKIKYIDDVAVLRKMDSDFEIHLKTKNPTWRNGWNTLEALTILN
jgi:hypothetical protein